MKKKIYILKGFHYSTFIPRIYKNKQNNLKKTITIKFNKSCIYDIDEDSCVNKLWGFSNGLFGVHENSYRFGWTYDKNSEEIKLWTYTYINGRLHKTIITSLEFDKEYSLSIHIVQLNSNVCTVIYNIDNKIVYDIDIPIKLNKYFLELGFYFGGNTRAPHNMCVEFDRI